MTRPVYISDTNCITPLGFDTDENIRNIEAGKSGIAQITNDWMPAPYFSAIIDDAAINKRFSAISGDHYTKLEKLLIMALNPIVGQFPPRTDATLILSTTKGNITALGDHNVKNAELSLLARRVSEFFGIRSTPIVISNACVSGVLAIATAKRIIQAGICNDAYVVSGDLVSEFVLSGFKSFQAMSEAPCKPYSANRTGVNLGEAAAAVYVTANPDRAKVQIIGDGAINDANHISGPSRTGEGLVRSITAAMREAGIKAAQIDYISAHGTATPFNDEMEAIALNRLGLQGVPVNSLKGYYGHTLGASGLLETVIAIESMNRNRLYASIGFDEIGVSQPIHVISQHTSQPIAIALKTASGFGGCNTAVLLQKVIS